MTEYVRYGITDLNGVGEAAYQAIVQGRPYTSFDDFLERRGAKCDSGAIDKLVQVGAFDSIEPHRAALVLRWEWIKRAQDENLCIWREENHLGPNGLPCTRDWSDVPVELKRDGTPKKAQKGPPKACTRGCWKYEPHQMPDFGVVPEFSPEELRNIEMDMLGVYLSSTPFSDLDQDDVAACATGSDLETAPLDEQKVVCVQITTLSSKKDRNGREMGFFTFLTADGYSFRAVAFSKTWDRLKSYAYERRLYWGLVTKNDRGWSIVGLEPA